MQRRDRGRQRRAVEGELCPCGRQAVWVYENGRFGSCDRPHRLGSEPHCVFCDGAIDHGADHGADHGTDDGTGRSAPAGTGAPRSGSPCPRYRLRLSDPPPVRSGDPSRPEVQWVNRPRTPGP